MWFYFEYDIQSASVDDSFSLGARYRQDRDKIRTRYRQDTDIFGIWYNKMKVSYFVGLDYLNYISVCVLPRNRICYCKI